jgi:hypothetical protein
MISESSYWKTPLLRTATWLERLFAKEETIDKSLARIEREIFVGFYAIRKLIPTFKLSNSTKQIKIDLQSFPIIKGETVDYFNKHNFDELFEIDAGTYEQRGLEFLCNQVIHSYVFNVVLNEDGSIKGFFIASDTTRHNKVYFVLLEQVVGVFRVVGRDYPEELHIQRDPKTGQWQEMSD